MKGDRVAIYVGLTIAAVVLLGLLVVRGWWMEFAPWPIQWHVGGLALGLFVALWVWLRKSPPSTGGTSRRRRRLRDRYRDPDGD